MFITCGICGMNYGRAADRESTICIYMLLKIRLVLKVIECSDNAELVIVVLPCHCA